MRYILPFGLLLAATLLVTACGGGSTVNTPGSQPTTDGFGINELAQPAGVDSALWDELKAALVAELAKVEAERAAAVAPQNPASIVEDFRVTLTPENDAVFEWSYRNQGDYDQNGEVNVADLTPIALNFGASSASPNWQTAQVVDGDGNGEVNLGDITPIATNFLNSVASYLLEWSSAADGPGWTFAYSVPFGTGSLPDGGGFLEFSFIAPSEELNNGDYFRSRPFSGNPGAPGGGQAEDYGIPSVSALYEYVAVPTDVVASMGTLVDQVNVMWSNFAGAEYYHVYRSDSEEGTYSKIGQSLPAEFLYSDTTVAEAVHYWYKVSAELADGETDMSDPAEGWSNTMPDPPANVQASDGTSSTGILVSWDRSAGASGYNVFRDADDFVVITLGDVDSWEDTGILDTDPHSYWVSAISYTLESAPAGPDTGYLGTAPTITGVTPDTFFQDSTITISATVTGDLPISYDWDFDQGAVPFTSTEEAPEITIASSGSYNASLTCTNPAGSDTFNFNIEIEPYETDLLMIYNSDMLEDLDLVEYYASPATGRGIHPDYRLGLPLGEAAAQTISRDLYGSDIRDPIIAFLDDPGNASIKANIKYLLMFKGVPYKIPGANGGDHNLSENSCVDSELCLLRSGGVSSGDGYRIAGPVWSGTTYQDWAKSGFYEKDNIDFTPDTFGVTDLDGGHYTLNYLVGRITAYTYEECKLMIDRSLAADTSGNGWTIFDSKTGSTIYETMFDPVWPLGTDEWDSGYELFLASGLNVFGDETADLVTREYAPLPAGAADNIIAYCSWGKHSAFDQLYILDDLDFNYLPGACFMSYESFNGTTMRNTNPLDPREGHPGQGQIADFIFMGGSVAIGNVYEPWTDGVGDERWVFDRYVNHGDRWIEAAYKGLYYFSWQEVVIGDPLCRVVAD